MAKTEPRCSRHAFDRITAPACQACRIIQLEAKVIRFERDVTAVRADKACAVADNQRLIEERDQARVLLGRAEQLASVVTNEAPPASATWDEAHRLHRDIVHYLVFPKETDGTQTPDA